MLTLSGLVIVTVVCVVTLWPPDEPKYQGRYLSEWMDVLSQARPGEPTQEAERALQAIGTNGLPYFLECLRYERPLWRMTASRWLPLWIRAKRPVFDWRIDARGQQRARSAIDGFRILGTNAVSAIPELKAMLSDHTNTEAWDRALKALVFAGEEGIPVLEAVFADPQQVNRWYVLAGFRDMVRRGYTNQCLPKLVEALTHTEVHVRLAATNFVQQLAPQLLTNAPAH